MSYVKVGNITNKTRSATPIVKHVVSTEQYRISDDAHLATFTNPDITVDSGDVEQIVYTTSSKKGSNQCRHTKSRTVYLGDPSKTTRIIQAGSGVYYDYGHHHNIAVASHTSAIATAKAAFGITLGTAVLGAGAQGYINGVAAALRPDLTTVSVPNFLADIDDIKSLFELWKSNVSLAKNLAGAHLNYKFGWKPTIGDIQAMVQGVTTLQKRIAEFESTLNVLFAKKKLISSTTVSKTGAFVVDTDGSCKWSGNVTQTLTGGIAWRPMPLAAMSNFEKTLRGLLDTLGFQLNPRIIWDAIPFTFVIDWFFGVGAWLQNFSIDTLELPIKYVDSYLQFKEEINIESYCLLSVNSATIKPQTLCPGSKTTEKLFQRMPIFPDYLTLSGLGWKMPTTSQKELLLSLAIVLSK